MDRGSIDPGGMALVWRLAGTVALCAIWIVHRTDEIGLILVLFLTIMGLARWRFTLPAWTILVDQAVCTAALILAPDSVFGFPLPIFDAFLCGRPVYAILVPAGLTLLRAWSVPAAAALGVAAVAGITVRLWTLQLAEARKEADRDRRERYDSENLRAELLSANVRIARMAESAERARIARDLHDHAGHEITAAGLALDAFRRLRDEGDPRADELLDQAGERIAGGMDILRRTVRGMAPQTAVGAGALEEICRRFTPCRVSYTVHGDTGNIPVHAWGVLESCLKEGLTNAVRHAAPERIDVSLDVSPHIVRLCVRHPADVSRGEGRGIGLRSLSERAMAVGGSVSTDTRDGFKLVCVLPLDVGTA